MKIKWIHIMDKQPEHDARIIEMHPPGPDGHWTMGMKKYYQMCSWDQLLKYYSEFNFVPPNFWWVYADEFPFPQLREYHEPESD